MFTWCCKHQHFLSVREDIPGHHIFISNSSVIEKLYQIIININNLPQPGQYLDTWHIIYITSNFSAILHLSNQAWCWISQVLKPAHSIECPAVVTHSMECPMTTRTIIPDKITISSKWRMEVLPYAKIHAMINRDHSSNQVTTCTIEECHSQAIFYN